MLEENIKHRDVTCYLKQKNSYLPGGYDGAGKLLIILPSATPRVLSTSLPLPDSLWGANSKISPTTSTANKITIPKTRPNLR